MLQGQPACLREESDQSEYGLLFPFHVSINHVGAACAAGTSALTLFGMLLRNTDGREALFRTIGRIFGGFSDTGKAFLIIASAPLSLFCWSFVLLSSFSAGCMQSVLGMQRLKRAQ